MIAGCVQRAECSTLLRATLAPPHPSQPLPFLQVIDVVGVLINLRTAIMRYRKPKTLDKFFRCAPQHSTAGRRHI